MIYLTLHRLQFHLFCLGKYFWTHKLQTLIISNYYSLMYIVIYIHLNEFHIVVIPTSLQQIK